MKKICILLCLALFISNTAYTEEGDSQFTGNFGINFFGYQTSYLTTGVVYQVEVRNGMDFVGGADFGIHTETDQDNEVRADFLIPLRIGLHFPFTGENVSFGFGTGLTPSFQFTHDSSGAGFLMGPYINGSMRIKVHPVMSVFFQLQQDLLFGKPDWIYTGTRAVMGISF